MDSDTTSERRLDVGTPFAQWRRYQGAPMSTDIESRVGTLRDGAPADFAVLDTPSQRHLSSDFDDNRVGTVEKTVEVVHRD